jgi:hypothetical protein
MNGLEASLVGKNVRSAALVNGGVEFATDKGLVRWEVEGECCSHSWIEHVDLELVGGEVFEVVQNELPPTWYAAHPGPPEAECLTLYGVTIRTAKGTGTIDFRNESNGYYGGWIEPVAVRS